AEWRENESFEGELPANWQIVTVEELLPPGGIFDGPFGSNLKSSDYSESGVRVIRLENVGHLRFISAKEAFVSPEKYQTLKKHTVGKGDIIFASFIDEEVRACLLPELATEAIAKADCFCLRPKAELVDRKYLVYQLVSQMSYNKLVEDVHGATRPRINTTQLRKLQVRICPEPEQHEIVHRVEALFAVADQIEARYAKAEGYVGRLTQSILAKAFRGELVPQVPDDEPASVLLERIREQRASAVAAPATRKPRSGGTAPTTLEPATPPPARRGRPPKAALPSPDLSASNGGQADIPLSKPARKILKRMKPGREHARADLADALGLSVGEWNAGINELKDAGLVVQSGERRGARYRIEE
ncbi:MAG: restriction endonuclease subunit S, partial [Planctomycetes bacterium]|nr:restriction endonuclease subunit S [Planctomycetota bacterium]